MILYTTSLTFIRMSVVLFYYRIFGTHRWYRMSLWIAAGIVIAWFVALNCLTLTLCTPIAKQWDYRIPGHCLPFIGAFIDLTISNVLVDLLLLILPLPMLWRLQINLKKKLALIANFVLGYRSVQQVNRLPQ